MDLRPERSAKAFDAFPMPAIAVFLGHRFTIGRELVRWFAVVRNGGIENFN